MKKWTVAEISEATGLSESTFTAAASNRDWKTKGGLDITQIIEILRMPRRNRVKCDRQKVEDLKRLLTELGEM